MSEFDNDDNKKLYNTVLVKKDLVVFPGVVTSIDVSEQKILDFLDLIIKNNDLIFIVLQKNSSNDVNVKNLYQVGVLCRVIQKMYKNDNKRILIEGVSKAKLLNIVKTTEGSIFSDIEIIKNEKLTEKSKKDLEKYKQILFNKMKDFANMLGHFNEDLFAITDLFKSVDELIFYFCAFISLTPDKKQELLEINNDLTKIKKFIEYIDIEYSIIQMDKKLNDQVEKKFLKHQKKAYLNEKIKQIKKELGEDSTDGDNTEDAKIFKLKKKMKTLKLSKDAKQICNDQLEKLENIPSYAAEYQVIKNYLELILSLPWGNKTLLTNKMKDAERILNRDHYGLEEVKERVLEFLAVYQKKKTLSGQIICFVGAPGVGKTSLAKSIAESLNRKYVKISLGGIRDEAEIRGHRKTYVGAMPGKIISSLKRVGTDNPLILLDEIDKIGKDKYGDPASALLEVLDPEQNKNFEDHFLDLEYDLSDVMFIATANNISNIPIPLRDRMEIIKLSGYTEEEKLNIAKKYLIEKQLEENGLKHSEFEIDDDAIIKIIRNYTFEAGVRNLEREIAKITRKIVKKMLLDKKIKKIHVTEQNLKDFLGVPKFDYNKVSKQDRVGVSVGLAYTDFGGDLLNIESLKFCGSGKLITTGKLGDVMKESAQAAFSYVRSIANKFNISPDEFNKYDFHLHVPEGATPKDGPSAGVAITASLLSSMTGKKINRDVAMTGEISLTGEVMPIGGLKEKLLAALRGNIKKVIIPYDNKKDLENIPNDVQKKMKVIPVKELDEALKVIIQDYN